MDTFKELFFAYNTKGKKTAEEWWARIQERNEATSGAAPSEWLSKGYKDGSDEIQN